MKALKGFILSLLVVFPLSATAFGQYVGAEVQCNFHKVQTNAKALPHLHVFAGKKINERFGFELGAYASDVLKDQNLCLRKQGVHGDVVGLVPLCHNVNLKAGVGVCQFFAQTDDKNIGKKKHHKILPRVLVGVEVDMCSNLTGRMHLVWEQASLLEKAHKTFKNDNLHLNIGLAYNF